MLQHRWRAKPKLGDQLHQQRHWRAKPKLGDQLQQERHWRAKLKLGDQMQQYDWRGKCRPCRRRAHSPSSADESLQNDRRT
jgi:hypothetical protein